MTLSVAGIVNRDFATHLDLSVWNPSDPEHTYSNEEVDVAPQRDGTASYAFVFPILSATWQTFSATTTDASWRQFIVRGAGASSPTP